MLFFGAFFSDIEKTAENDTDISVSATQTYTQHVHQAQQVGWPQPSQYEHTTPQRQKAEGERRQKPERKR